MRRMVLLFVLALLARPAFSGYSSLVVFGDSLSDGGNASALSGGNFPPTPPYAGQFSNGPTAVQYLGNSLGVSNFAPSVLGGTNYAVGGATTGLTNFNFQVNSPAGVNQIGSLQFTGMQAQVGSYLASGNVSNPNSTLYVVWGGPNDLFLAQATGADPAATAGTAITNLASEVAALAVVAGAQRVLVPNLPNLGATPEAGGNAAALTALSAGFNAGLAAAMAQVEQQTGTDVIMFDTFAFLNEVIQNASAYGFTNTTGQCVQSLAALQSNCSGYLFFDSVHPTTAAHQILGNMFFRTVPEPGSLILLIAMGVALYFATRPRNAKAKNKRKA